MTKKDEFGPEEIIRVPLPNKAEGITVIDNTALGPAKGGIRMTPTVTVDEVARLARAMTWKCALAGLPFGGGKSGIVADPKKISKEEKMEIIRAFSKALKPVSPSRYVAAPDMNMAEEEMRAFAEANGSMKSATGKPADMCASPGVACGIPHEYGSTGYGVFHATLVGIEFLGLKDPTIAVEGFGNVGSFVAKYLFEHGLKIVAVSDSKGTIYNKDGIDIRELEKVKKKTGSVINYNAKKLSNEELFTLDVDIIIPSALPDVINEKNVDKITAKLIVEGANIPASSKIEKKLHERGILVIPDFVANAGGVISSYVEYLGDDPQSVFSLIEEKIKRNTRLVLKHAEEEKITPRNAGLNIAVRRVREAMKK